MPLPSSGTISMSQINTELGRGSTAAISINNAATGQYVGINTCGSPYPNNSQPHAMSEWYSYNHSASCCTPYGTFHSSYCSGCNLIYQYHDGACGFYTVDQGCHGPCGGGCCCPAFGVYAFTDCSYNPTNFCIETTDWYHDGTCGYYPVYSFICSC